MCGVPFAGGVGRPAGPARAPTPDTGRGGRATVEPPGRGCHLRSGPRSGAVPVRRAPSTPMFFLVLEEEEISSSNHRGCGRCGWTPSGLLRRRGGLWVALGTDSWTGGRNCGQHGRSASCPRAVHGLSTDPGAFIPSPAGVHPNPAGVHPQSYPQVWVDCARTGTLCDRSTTPGWCPRRLGIVGDTARVHDVKRAVADPVTASITGSVGGSASVVGGTTSGRVSRARARSCRRGTRSSSGHAALRGARRLGDSLSRRSACPSHFGSPADTRCTGRSGAAVQWRARCLIRAVSSWTCSKVLRRWAISLRIFLSACMTVVWSRPPNVWPMRGSERSVSSRHRYMAI